MLVMQTINYARQHGFAMTNSVCAIVVTRNRLDKLKRCVEFLGHQSYPVHTAIIVDNGSTDGTDAYAKGIDTPMRIIYCLQDNVGGAGGFHRGLSEFLKTDCDWAWLMDDDGWPDHNALQYLTPDYDKHPLWRNSLVLDESNTERLAFGLCDNGAKIDVTAQISDTKAHINSANPFNGTLLHRSLVEAIGLPVRELFIKGDETEYQRRAIRLGFEVVTLPESRFYHPALREVNICDVDDSRVWVYYYKVRNIDVVGTSTGAFRYNKKSAFFYAKNYFKEVLRCYKNKKLNAKQTANRLVIVWLGCAAAIAGSKYVLLP
jgi:glycosyltransferase involved in cell wall biosynthesis